LREALAEQRELGSNILWTQPALRQTFVPQKHQRLVRPKIIPPLSVGSSIGFLPYPATVNFDNQVSFTARSRRNHGQRLA
jgi:hypothetical protein